MVRLLEAKDEAISAGAVLVAERDALITERDALISEQETLINKLRHQLANLARARFGASAEKLNPDQLQRKRGFFPTLTIGAAVG